MLQSRDESIEFCTAGALNLTQYSGLYGGKWCYSIFDPPPPAGKKVTPGIFYILYCVPDALILS